MGNCNELLDLAEEIDALSITDKQVKDHDDPTKLINVNLITFNV